MNKTRCRSMNAVLVATQTNQQTNKTKLTGRPAGTSQLISNFTLALYYYSEFIFYEYKHKVIRNEYRDFYNLPHTIHLEIGVCSCTDGSRNSQSFILWCAVCSSYALSIMLIL
jgi:hypothetical protein